MRSLILGHRGMVGAALRRLLPDAEVMTKYSPDLRIQEDIEIAFGLHGVKDGNVDVLYLCAAKVGGIEANRAKPGEFIYDNLMIQTNVIEAARRAGVKLFVFLGSSCIYPAVQQFEAIPETALMSGPLEPTNESYAVAKIAGIKMLEAYHRQYGMEFLAVMPCNLYGSGDNYNPESSHFIAGMISRFHEAKVSRSKSVTLWGTGRPRREIMHVDDCARIITELVRKGARGIINIGPGLDQTIATFAELVHPVVGFAGSIEWDDSRPDGVARKLLDVSKMLGFGVRAHIGVTEGIADAYECFLQERG